MCIVSPFLSRLTLAIALSLAVVGCGKSVENTVKIDYLLPQLRNAQIHSIALSSEEGSTKLSRRDGKWWVDEPVNYIAEQRVIEPYLRAMIDAEIGKKVSVIPSDLHRLELADGDGITNHLLYGDNKELTFILGTVDFPDDTGSTGLLGPGYSARRYIRVIEDARDEVFLVPVSLVDLSAASPLWTDHSFMRIPSLRRLRVKVDGAVTQDYFRPHMFGPLYRRDADGSEHQMNPNLFACFEEFLKFGQCYHMGDSATQFEPRKSLQQISVIIDDFLGAAYTFRFGENIDPTQAEDERAALSMGAFNSGEAPIVLPFTLDTTNTDIELNPFNQALRDANRVISQRLLGRVAYMKLENAYCMLNILEGTK